MTITVGTDSFISIADADAYMASRVNASKWPDDVDQKERALKTATGILNRESYAGCIAATSQALAWPRVGVIDPEGRPIASTDIPKAIAHATAELALFLLTHNVMDEFTRRRLLRVRFEAVGQSQASYAASAPDNLPHIVRSLIRPYTRTASAHSVELKP